MAKKYLKSQIPLILRYHRLMDAFAKSDEERDFYLDHQEGFIVFADLNKAEQDLLELDRELKENPDRYCLIPKLSFFEIKKIMEGFVNEKVYDIDTKEKLIDVIQAKDARENFLEFIYDHLSELEKWQQYYQERSRIRIIEWLRINEFDFVFEEDLSLPKSATEKLKQFQFTEKVPKDIAQNRKFLFQKAQTYYSNEALNPKPKRGRPPKQIAKIEVEPQLSDDVYLTVPTRIRTFVYTPDITSASDVIFSAKYENEEDFLANLKNAGKSQTQEKLNEINERLASLNSISQRLASTKLADARPSTEEIDQATASPLLKMLSKIPEQDFVSKDSPQSAHVPFSHKLEESEKDKIGKKDTSFSTKTTENVPSTDRNIKKRMRPLPQKTPTKRALKTKPLQKVTPKKRRITKTKPKKP